MFQQSLVYKNRQWSGFAHNSNLPTPDLKCSMNQVWENVYVRTVIRLYNKLNLIQINAAA